MKSKNLFIFMLALVVSLPVVANQEFTYTDPNGVVWTYEFVDETDPSQGIVITSSISTTDGLVLPLEINDGETTLPVIGISLTLEEGITSIPDGFFSGCANLTSIVIPNTVISIGDDAFIGCKNLVSVSIPESVVSIGTQAFTYCESLTSITIPNSVTSMGVHPFGGCSNLASVIYPNSISYIPDGCFFGCRSLISFTIPQSVTRIENGAFSYCESLTSITIPSSVTYMGTGVFDGCSALTSIIVDEGNTVYDSRENCNAIIETASNTLISGCQSTNIPTTVTIIGEGAFGGIGLNSIFIPSGVIKIENAFEGNNPASIIVAEDNSVYDSRDNCNAIIETASNTLVKGCKNTVMPSSITNIGTSAFLGCNDFTSITIPSSVKNIGDFAFYYNGLTSVIIPEGVVSLGAFAFAGNNFTSLTIPSTVTSIDGRSFDGGGNLASIVVNEGNPKYDSRHNCNALIETESNTIIIGCRNTTIPSTVTCIGSGAFPNCGFTAITTDPLQASETCLYIPSSVTSIISAFTGELTTVTLPEGLTELGENAFGGGVTSLISTKTTPFVLENPNIGVALNCVLHIPAGTKDAYIAAGWTEEVFGGGIVEDGVVPESVSVTLSSIGAGTFCSKYALDFSGTDDVKAYIVSAFLPRTGEVTLTRIKYVPAMTGIVLLGTVGTYDIPITDEQAVVADLLVGVTERTQLYRTDGRYTNFVLANGSSGLGFYTVADGSTLAANRAYLPLLTYLVSTSASSISIRFDDDATMIDDMEAESEAAEWHDLSGRTLNELPSAKGVYIVNGKKVVVK